MKLEDYKMKIVSFKCNQKYLKVKIKHFKLEMIHLKFFLNKQEKKNYLLKKNQKNLKIKLIYNKLIFHSMNRRKF